MKEIELPFYERIKIFHVDDVPDNDLFFSTYFLEWNNFIGYYIFKLNECIDPECIKKGKIFVGTIKINFYITKLCELYLKDLITETELYPYLY